MAFDEYAEHDGLGLAALVAKGEVSPAELVEAAIARIERHNGVLNAVVEVKTPCCQDADDAASQPVASGVEPAPRPAVSDSL